ncbi:hypothetical protein M9H77_16492 [Catharanthus roseus]|uniref:Uncharacterized protein n=1 Tax=Catharanthus roseus TaxID=4058 RepID=A0ACC0B1X3_CATRO|nr:hypothetical protein M9H77_16492 [Catharanthus roseus]
MISEMIASSHFCNQTVQHIAPDDGVDAKERLLLHALESIFSGMTRVVIKLYVRREGNGLPELHSGLAYGVFAEKGPVKSLIIETELFRVVKERCGDNEGLRSLLLEKVVKVSGDISCDQNLKIRQDSNLSDDMFKEIDIIVNSAAVTNCFESFTFTFVCNDKHQ